LPDPGRRIVAIEDDAVLRSVMADILVDEGYEVVVHGRPEGAQQLVRCTQPAVVLLDLRLGEARAEGGWGILDQLVLDPATRHIPVVTVSGDASLETRRLAISAEHGLWVLGKPFDLADLLEVVSRAVAFRQGHRRDPVPASAGRTHAGNIGT
jgi:two-component system nitrogen regulation response regulator NtrX